MRWLVALSPALVLAACSEEAAPPPAAERDPMAVTALSDPIMVDPDLSQQNEANAALTVGTDHSLPAVVATREAIAAARQEAAQLAGGTGQLRPLGSPRTATAPLPDPASYSVVELARLVPAAAACAHEVSFTAAWAARMPPAMPIYPRGNTIEAAGRDADGCRLRAVRFLTPVTAEDVLPFYAAMARRAGLPARYSRAGDIDVLQGTAGERSYAVYLRRRSAQISEVGLVTSGW